MRGPGLHVSPEVRRRWRCPACQSERMQAQTETTVLCRCQDPPLFMQLQESQRINRRESRPVARFLEEDDFPPEEVLTGDEAEEIIEGVDTSSPTVSRPRRPRRPAPEGNARPASQEGDRPLERPNKQPRPPHERNPDQTPEAGNTSGDSSEGGQPKARKQDQPGQGTQAPRGDRPNKGKSRSKGKPKQATNGSPTNNASPQANTPARQTGSPTPKGPQAEGPAPAEGEGSETAPARKKRRRGRDRKKDRLREEAERAAQAGNTGAGEAVDSPGSVAPQQAAPAAPVQKEQGPSEG